MLFFSPFRKLVKLQSSLTLGAVVLAATTLGLGSPQSNPIKVLEFEFSPGYIFSSWWYLGLEILLTASLVACSILDQFFVLKCQSNLTRNPSRININAQSDSSQESAFLARASRSKKAITRITDSRSHIMQKGTLRELAPVGTHALITSIVTYSTLGALYCFEGSAGLNLGEGLFLSELKGPRSSSIHARPMAYARVNDSWVLNDPYQPFMDLSFLSMDGEEYGRFTITTSSKEATFPSQGISLDGSLSLLGSLPQRVRLVENSTYREIPALTLGQDNQTSWLAPNNEDEVLVGRDGGVMRLWGQPPLVGWEQQDMSELLDAKGRVMVEVLSEGNLSWSNNQFNVEIFFLPLLILLTLLLVFSKDVSLCLD